MMNIILKRVNRRKEYILGGCFLVIFAIALYTYRISFTGRFPIQSFLQPTFSGIDMVPNDLADSTPDIIRRLWKPLLFDLNATRFVTSEGRSYEVPTARQHWSQPLGKKLLILDVDTRLDNSPGSIMNKTLNPNELSGRAGGIMNHYLYAMIHGYNYRFVRAPGFSGRHGTWVKVPIIREALKAHDFVVFLDADAGFMHMELPFEWLMNYWNITNKTLVALSNDPDSPRNRDEKGKVMQNTGFIVARQDARSQKLFSDWEHCPTEVKYKGCKHWEKDWAHEQAAFANYVRYDYSSTGEIGVIPCGEGNGAPYIGDKTCNGVFVRHHWFKKDRPALDLQQLISDTVIRRIHAHFLYNKKNATIDATSYRYMQKDEGT